MFSKNIFPTCKKEKKGVPKYLTMIKKLSLSDKKKIQVFKKDFIYKKCDLELHYDYDVL